MPLLYLVDNAGTNHAQIDEYQTTQQMLSGFDGSRVLLSEGSPFNGLT
jgi:hypothetical protein